MNSVADYDFVDQIGAGNHGSFWRSRRPQRLDGIDEEYVAVKTLDHSATDQDFGRMADELRTYASVESPYLAEVIDAGHQDGQLFYTTRYFHDGSLGSPRTTLSPNEAGTVVRHAALGAHGLHEAGVAHRDIKPENIMLSRANGAVSGQLGDLGLAQVINPGLTLTGLGPVGTIEYLAPELVHGDGASRASDIWALGMTLHRALTGQTVYADLPTGSQLEALRYVMAAERVVDPSLPAIVRELIGRCLEEDPSDRFLTAEELAEAIEKVDFGG